jgi:two-component system NtrC family sensor kinase
MRRFQLDRRAFRSRVARRIFLVFGISALLPVIAFAAFTLLKVDGALDRAARQRLRDESKAAGMAILDRLVASELTIQLLAGADPDGPAAGLVIAELDPSQVWRPDTLRADMGLVVRDAQGQVLFASAPELASAEDGSHGEQIWIAGEPHLRASWMLFLGSMFGADGWSIDCLQSKSLVLGPLAQFRAAFIPVATLAGGLALFLSSGLIRRSLDPIEALHAATDAVARGDFDRRVTIDTNDEFRDLGDAFNDLTRNLEAKVAARTRELQEALEELRRTQGQLVHQEKMASLGHFVAGIAHELNNPLAFVEGNLHFLRQYTETLVDALASYDRETTDADPQLRTKLAGIRSQLDLDQLLHDLEPTFEGCADGILRATTLVEDLRTFSRNDAADRAQVDLSDALDATLNILRGRLEGVDLVRDYGDLPLVECQAAQLNQVFLNLVSNALDATDDGGRVVIRTRRLGDDRVSIEVEDDGRGMDAETVKRVFEPFYTTKEVGRGTGLGLSISYGIIERHGGQIEVESEAGRGTRFRVILPVRLADEPPDAPDPREPEPREMEPQEMNA